MRRLIDLGFGFLCACSLLLSVETFSQNPSIPAQSAQSPAQIVERANLSVAMVLATRSSGPTPNWIGTALVVREDGILLTAYHLIKEANSVQVRFKSGETFDQVQLLGIDARRDIAAIRITASGLPILPLAPMGTLSPGDTVITVSHPEALPWSASTGVVSAVRMADEVPGAGSGFRVIQFTAPSSAGSSGGVLIDAQGRAAGLIVGSITEGQNLNFAVPIESVMGLVTVAQGKTFASGAALIPPHAKAQSIPEMAESREPGSVATPNQAERSDLLKNSQDKDYILRNFKTMFIDCQNANFFGSEQLKAALMNDPNFAPLDISIVEASNVADTILKVSYTFAWDYPFVLIHQNTSAALVAGKGSGPFSGPAGAKSVASNFIKLMRPYRTRARAKQ